jgi:hypothetical protein
MEERMGLCIRAISNEKPPLPGFCQLGGFHDQLGILGDPKTPVVIEGKATPKVLVGICESAPHSAETDRYTRK